jgi:AcrR family transcriptional regulator
MMNQLTTPQGAPRTRIQPSKTKLRRALLKLMETRPLNRITVKGLCEQAAVDRTTFYKYYKSVDELYQHIKSEALEEYRKIVSAHLADCNPAQYTLNLLLAIKENQDLTNTILVAGHFEIAEDIIEMARPSVVDFWRTTFKIHDERTLSWLYTSIAFAIFGMVYRWSQNNFRDDPAELADYLVRGINNGIAYYAKKPN